VVEKRMNTLWGFLPQIQALDRPDATCAGRLPDRLQRHLVNLNHYYFYSWWRLFDVGPISILPPKSTHSPSLCFKRFLLLHLDPCDSLTNLGGLAAYLACAAGGWAKAAPADPASATANARRMETFIKWRCAVMICFLGPVAFRCEFMKKPDAESID
jgi:hypothetical protein